MKSAKVLFDFGALPIAAGWLAVVGICGPAVDSTQKLATVIWQNWWSWQSVLVALGGSWLAFRLFKKEIMDPSVNPWLVSSVCSLLAAAFCTMPWSILLFVTQRNEDKESFPLWFFIVMTLGFGGLAYFIFSPILITWNGFVVKKLRQHAHPSPQSFNNA